MYVDGDVEPALDEEVEVVGLNEPVEGFEWAWSTKCEDRCPGDMSQTCGGSNALSIWTTLPFHLNGVCLNDYPQNNRVLNEFSITGLENLTLSTCGEICKGQ